MERTAAQTLAKKVEPLGLAVMIFGRVSTLVVVVGILLPLEACLFSIRDDDVPGKHEPEADEGAVDDIDISFLESKIVPLFIHSDHVAVDIVEVQNPSISQD